MAKQVKISERELKQYINEAISNVLKEEGIDEVNWFQRFGNNVRNTVDNVKNQVGGAVAGAKAGLKYGGANAAAAGRNDYLAKKNADLAQSRKQEADAAIAKFKAEYGKKVGELNSWKASEIRQIKQMYGADAFANKSANATSAAQNARNSQNAFWNGGNNAGQNNYRQVAESVEKIVGEVIKKVLD